MNLCSPWHVQVDADRLKVQFEEEKQGLGAHIQLRDTYIQRLRVQQVSASFAPIFIRLCLFTRVCSGTCTS